MTVYRFDAAYIKALESAVQLVSKEHKKEPVEAFLALLCIFADVYDIHADDFEIDRITVKNKEEALH